MRTTLAFLLVRYGGWRALAAAMDMKADTVKYAAHPRGGVSAGAALRTARAAGVPVEDVLSGAFPRPGVCPHCGRG